MARVLWMWVAGVVVAGAVAPLVAHHLPDALAKKQANAASWMTLDPEVKCFMPGVPRATYQPYPFQIGRCSRGPGR